VSLLAGIATAVGAMLMGVTLGILSGYYTGWVETVIMRLTDILMAFPYILLAIAIVAGLGPGLRNAMIAIAIVGFPLYTRLVRGSSSPSASASSSKRRRPGEHRLPDPRTAHRAATAFTADRCL